MKELQKLPVTESGFEALRKQNMLYVDKTERMLELIDKGSYLFLSRPRRFGKSLLINTLKALFENKKVLFEGLYIYDKWEWEEHGVIHLDFSKILYRRGIEDFENHIKQLFQNIATSYNLELKEGNYLFQFQSLISKLYEKFNRGVIVLIDEYDKPIVDFINEPTKAEENRAFLREFYTTLKAEHAHLRLVFVTGVSKLAKVSVFSGMNNTLDVSLHPKMNDLVGITYDELVYYFENQIATLQEKNECSREEILAKIKYWYNGYSWDGKNKIYNPYAIVNLMDLQEFKNFWFESGTPTLLINLIIQKAYAGVFKKMPTDYEDIEVGGHVFETAELEHLSVEGLMFQTGYLTITDIFREDDLTIYRLNYPNYEVRYSFMVHIIEKYAEFPKREIESGAFKMKRSLRHENLTDFIALIQRFFAIIPYHLRKKADEAYYHSILQILFVLVGIEMISERAIYDGRIDGVIEYEDKIYILEFKHSRKGTLKKLANNAMEQIKNKQYAKAYQQTNKRIILIGIGFLEKNNKKSEEIKLEIDGIWEEVK
jgi:hypothetical protein